MFFQLDTKENYNGCKKVYYDGKCIMTVDMDYAKEDSIREYLNEILGAFKERAYEEFDIENRFESEVRKIWQGNEHIYELKNQIEQKIKQESEQEIEDDSIDRKIEKGLREVEQLFSAMKEILNADEFELFKKLRNEEVHCLNDLETKFFAGNGCLDYVWVEYNGEKESRL